MSQMIFRWQDCVLGSVWMLAAVAYFAFWATSGYVGWATGFTLWSLAALFLVACTNGRLRGSGRPTLQVRHGERWLWVAVATVAIASQLLITRLEAPVAETSLSRAVGWALLGLVWALLFCELYLVGLVSYRALHKLAAPLAVD